MCQGAHRTSPAVQRRHQALFQPNQWVNAAPKQVNAGHNGPEAFCAGLYGHNSIRWPVRAYIYVKHMMHSHNAHPWFAPIIIGIYKGYIERAVTVRRCDGPQRGLVLCVLLSFPMPKFTAKRAAKVVKITFEQQTPFGVKMVFILAPPLTVRFGFVLNPRQRGDMKKHKQCSF